MPESSFLDMVRDRVSEVSQSGLTHELGLEFVEEVVVGLEFELGSLLIEALTEKERNGVVCFIEGVGRRVNDEKEWREQGMATVNE